MNTYFLSLSSSSFKILLFITPLSEEYSSLLDTSSGVFRVFDPFRLTLHIEKLRLIVRVKVERIKNYAKIPCV